MKIAIGQTLGTDRSCRLADRQDFSMGGRVPEFDCSIACRRDNIAAAYDDRAYRNLISLRGGGRLG